MTVFTLSVSGATTPTGAATEKVQLALTGSTTPAGTLTLFGSHFVSAAAARLRAASVAGRRLASLTAAATRTRAGRTFGQTINPTTADAMRVRWRFDDLATGAFYVFDVNPLAGGSGTAKRPITSTPTTAADGTPVTHEGDSDMTTGEFSGTVRSLAQYEAFKAWAAARRPVQLTDDLLRRSIIVLLRVSPKRKYTRQHPAKQEVTVTYRILQQTDV